MSSLQQLLNVIKTQSHDISFDEVQQVINDNYLFQPTSFTNGLGVDRVTNAEGSNEGSCRIFSFARMHNLSEAQTLACFGDYYRSDVLGNPEGVDHANIRRFMRDGWRGIVFESVALHRR